MATKKTTAKAATVKKTVEPLEAAVAAGKGAAEPTAKTVAKPVEKTPVAAPKAVAAAKKPAEKAAKAAKPVFEGYGEFMTVGKENVEAMVKSGNLLAKGMETLGKEVMDFARLSIEGNVAATKELMGVKSFKEAVDLQADLAKKNAEQIFAETVKLTELSVKVTNEAMEPIQARVDVAMKQFGKPLAA